MCKKLFSTAALLCLAVLATQAAEENPLKNAKVGDFVSHKITTNAGGMAMNMETKRTIINKTDTEVTIETCTKAMGHETKNTRVVKLDEKFDPKEIILKAQPGATFKELGKGEETITVAGKAMKTTWTSYELTGVGGQAAVSMKGKAWVCPDVPLGGMVKSESDMGGRGTMTVELVDFGTAK
ncbi:MAG: hypothetical protein ABSE73_10955 [Planctomycetota bacterium]